MEPDSASRLKSVGAGLLRWGLFLLVLWFVATQAQTMWDANRDINVQIDWKYLVAAGVLSQISWLPSTWFWQRLIELLGDQNQDSYPLIRACFCGSVCKFVTGKAAVILIRSALAKKHGVSFVRASIASVVEAGAVMLVGCVVTVVFALTVVPPDAVPTWFIDAVPRESTSWSSLLLAVVLLVLAMPIVAGPANWIFAKITRIIEKRSQFVSSSDSGENVNSAEETGNQESPDPTTGKLTSQFLVAASLMFALSWAGHGLSLLLVLRSMNPEILTINAWTIATAAAAAGTSIGFFAVFAPGGLAVREGLIITMLAPSMGGPIAVAAAGLYRLASLIAESIAALILYVVRPRGGSDANRNHEESAA